MSVLDDDIKNLKHWAKEMMPIEVWIPVNSRQLKAFRMLILEQYGWPEFTLNINKSGDKVMKIMVW